MPCHLVYSRSVERHDYWALPTRLEAISSNWKFPTARRRPKRRLSLSRLRSTHLHRFVSTADLPDGSQGDVYDAEFAATGAVSDLQLVPGIRFASGRAPLNDDGSITGTPTDSGSFVFEAEATDFSMPTPETATDSFR